MSGQQDPRHIDRASFTIGIVVGIILSIVFVVGFLLVDGVTKGLLLG